MYFLLLRKTSARKRALRDFGMMSLNGLFSVELVNKRLYVTWGGGGGGGLTIMALK